MIDSPSKTSPADFRQRYEGSYAFYLVDTGRKIPVKISRVRDSNIEVVDRNNINFKFLWTDNVELEFTQVNAGWYFISGAEVLVTRKQERQWRRGICESTTLLRCYNPKNKFFDDISYTLSLDCVAEIYSPPKKKGGVLSRFFAISHGVLFFMDIKIGECVNNSIKLTPEGECFRQELVDTINRNKLEYTLK